MTTSPDPNPPRPGNTLRGLAKEPSPHLHDTADSRRIMCDVLLALVPAVLGSVYFFGPGVLAFYGVAVAAAVLLDFAWRTLVRKASYRFDWTPVVTGVLLAMSLPASAPLWFPVLGSAVGIILAKEAFGGVGRNFLNPAVAGRFVLRLLFVAEMTDNVWPRAGIPVPPQVDAVSGATPLMLVKDGLALDGPTLAASFWGNVGGKIGETSAFLLLLGAGYLLLRRVIGGRIPLSILGTIAVLALGIGVSRGLRLELPSFVLGHLLGGATILGAFFMATDYSSSPSTRTGQVLFGVGVGAVTMAYRVFGSYSEGFTFALVFINLLVPILNRYTTPRVVGTGLDGKPGASGKET